MRYWQKERETRERIVVPRSFVPPAGFAQCPQGLCVRCGQPAITYRLRNGVVLHPGCR